MKIQVDIPVEKLPMGDELKKLERENLRLNGRIKKLEEEILNHNFEVVAVKKAKEILNRAVLDLDGVGSIEVLDDAR